MDSKLITGVIGFVIGLVPAFLQYLVQKKTLSEHTPLDKLAVVSEAEQRLRNDMNSRIEDLKQENKELKQELKEIKAENTELQKRVAVLEKAISKIHVSSSKKSNE